MVCFTTKAECLIHMRALDQELLWIEREETLDADQAEVLGIDCTDVYIQVVKPEDMSSAWKETGRGGCMHASARMPLSSIICAVRYPNGLLWAVLGPPALSLSWIARGHATT